MKAQRRTAITFIVIILFHETLSATRHFRPHEPVVWKKSEREAVKGAEIIHFDILLINPCNVYSQFNTTFQDNVKQLFKSCNATFHSEIIDTLDRFVDPPVRTKRALAFLGLLGVGYTLLAGSAAPLAVTPVGWTIIGIAAIVGLGYTIFKTSSTATAMSTTIETLEQHQQLFQTVQRDLKQLEAKSNQLSNDFNEFVDLMTDVTEISSQINSKLHVRGHELREALDEHKKGKVSRTFISALNLTLPCGDECKVEYMSPVRFRKVENYHYRVTILAIITDKSTKILQADPFELVVENATHTCNSIYRGDHFLIHNGSIQGDCQLFSFEKERGTNLYLTLHSRCEPHSQEWVHENCKHRAYGKIKPKVQIKQESFLNIIYCPCETIQVNDEPPVECPEHVFSLEMTASFRVGSFHFKGKEEVTHITVRDQIMRETIHRNIHHKDNKYRVQLELPNATLATTIKGLSSSSIIPGIIVTGIALALWFFLSKRQKRNTNVGTIQRHNSQGSLVMTQINVKVPSMNGDVCEEETTYPTIESTEQISPSNRRSERLAAMRYSRN